MTFANNFDPNEAPQNVGFHLRFKLYDIQIYKWAKVWIKIMIFLQILKEKDIENKNWVTVRDKCPQMLTRFERTDQQTDERTDGRTDSSILLCLKFYLGA